MQVQSTISVVCSGLNFSWFLLWEGLKNLQREHFHSHLFIKCLNFGGIPFFTNQFIVQENSIKANMALKKLEKVFIAQGTQTVIK